MALGTLGATTFEARELPSTRIARPALAFCRDIAHADRRPA